MGTTFTLWIMLRDDYEKPHSMREVNIINTEVQEEDKVETSGMTPLNIENPEALNTFEDLLKAVGTNGRWNIFVLIICAFSTC